jgi:hypothetical protein
MAIAYTCRCGYVVRSPDSSAGQPGRCPACTRTFVVPLPEGQAAPVLHGRPGDYPLRSDARGPARGRSRFDGLTSDDVQLRPRLDEEDEEQRDARRRHRVSQPVPDEDEEDDGRRRALRLRVAMLAIGVLMMFGGGAWFRFKIDRGEIVLEALILCAAGLMLSIAAGLGYLRLSGRWAKRRPAPRPPQEPPRRSSAGR